MSRAGDTVRYASRTTGVNFEKILTWGAIGVGLYLALQIAGVVKKASDAGAVAISSARDALASGLYAVLGPKLDWPTYLSVRFPDGSTHSVPSNKVDSSGIFVNDRLSPNYLGDGKRYKILTDKKVLIGVNKTAFPV